MLFNKTMCFKLQTYKKTIKQKQYNFFKIKVNKKK